MHTMHYCTVHRTSYIVQEVVAETGRMQGIAVPKQQEKNDKVRARVRKTKHPSSEVHYLRPFLTLSHLLKG